MPRAFDPDLDNMPFRVPNTRRSIDYFNECLTRAARNLNQCRVLADSVPALRETLDAARRHLGHAAQESLIAQENTFFACGIADLCEPETVHVPAQAVIDALARHARAVSVSKTQADVREAVIEAATALGPLIDEGGLSRLVAARVLGEAADAAGVDEAAATVWALETFRYDEVIS